MPTLMQVKRFSRVFFLFLLFIVPSKGISNVYENPPGWKWLIEPMKINVGSGHSINGILMISSIDHSGAFTLTVGWKPEEGTNYRPVVFDSLKQRYLSDSSTGPGAKDMIMTKYTWNNIKIENIARIGFEMLTPAGWLVASKEALKRAKKMGIKVLPYPQIGEPFEFELETYDGGLIRSKELLGKVVVLDCWATWCNPCMQKIPDIQKLQKEFSPKHFEVIGINFDFDTELLEKALKQKAINWRTVHVPTDSAVRDLWFDASSIDYLPRLFVLDQDGMMRLDSSDINKLKSIVTNLTGGPR